MGVCFPSVAAEMPHYPTPCGGNLICPNGTICREYWEVSGYICRQVTHTVCLAYRSRFDRKVAVKVTISIGR